MALGGGAFRRYLGLDEVMRVEPPDEISALIRTGGDQSPISLYCVRYRKQTAICKPGRRALTRNKIDWHIDLGLPSLQNGEK